MTNLRTFKREISAIRRLWADSQFSEAIAKVEDLRREYPGNPQVLVMWASLVQLVEDSEHSLDDAREALRLAVELDETSPGASIELGHYFDSVEDDPASASKAFASAAAIAKKLLVDALAGQGKSYLQLNRRTDAVRCLLEAFQVSNLDYPTMNGKSTRSPLGNPIPVELENLLNEALTEVAVIAD